MARPTVTTLAAALVQIGFVSKPFTTKDLRKGVKGVSDETYGRKSVIYLYTASPEARSVLTGKLSDLGIEADSLYNPGGRTVAVNVSYFKGWHWDE